MREFPTLKKKQLFSHSGICITDVLPKHGDGSVFELMASPYTLTFVAKVVPSLDIFQPKCFIHYIMHVACLDNLRLVTQQPFQCHAMSKIAEVLNIRFLSTPQSIIDKAKPRKT